MNCFRKSNLTMVVLLNAAMPAWAGEVKQAMITSVAGMVELFTPAMASATGSKVIFEGKTFESKKASIGTKIFPNDILRTGTNGKLKIIYDNGDVFLLGPATAFTVPTQTGDQKVVAEVVYGKVRGVIEKGGPLSGIQIRTKSVVAGVRGTDLFVSYDPGAALSEVHVLRGEVSVKKAPPATVTAELPRQESIAMTMGRTKKMDEKVDAGKKVEDKSTAEKVEAGKPETGKSEDEVIVSTGQKAVAQGNPNDSSKASEPTKADTISGSSAGTKAGSDGEAGKGKEPPKVEFKLEVKSSTQQELRVINQSTTVQKVAMAEIPKEQKVEIQKLEELATKKIVEDIKLSNPDAVKALEGKKIENVEQANQIVVQDLTKLAPKGNKKPKRSDFEKSEDVYKKFFKSSTE